MPTADLPPPRLLVAHPQGHISFASSHDGRKPFETIPVPLADDLGAEENRTIDQMLWYVILFSRLLLAQVDESPDTCASRPDH